MAGEISSRCFGTVLRTIAYAALAGQLTVPAFAREPGSLYLGIGVGTVAYRGTGGGVAFTDSTPGYHFYGGYQVSSRWAIEAAYQLIPDADSGQVPGSGIRWLRIEDRFSSVSVRALRRFSLSDLFDWKQDLSLFGTIGYFESSRRSDTLELTAGSLAHLSSDEGGVEIGFGVAHRRDRLMFRGFARQLVPVESRPLRDYGIAVEFRF